MRNNKQMIPGVTIGDRLFGPNQPVFIVAELSCNHLQDYQLAVKTLEAMKEAGADAVKVQAYLPDSITIDSDQAHFQIQHGTVWDGTTLYQLYQQAYTPWEWLPKLQQLAHELEMEFFSSAFDHDAIKLLEKMDVPVHKVASFEITDIPLIQTMARTGKPIIISTGVAALEDIELAVTTVRQQQNDQIFLLKCTSAYPTPLEEVNLATMTNLAERFQTLVGLSDHTAGSLVPIMAVALGACIIEKHFILDRDSGGPDAAFSMEPQEFASMVQSIRRAETARGSITYQLSSNVESARKFSRSLFVVEDVKKGQRFNQKNVRSIRPGDGMHPKYYEQVMGKNAAKDIGRGTPLSEDLIQGNVN